MIPVQLQEIKKLLSAAEESYDRSAYIQEALLLFPQCHIYIYMIYFVLADTVTPTCPGTTVNVKLYIVPV